MQEFNMKKAVLRQFKTDTKIIYTAFLGLCLANYLVMAVLGFQRAGFTLESIKLYYLGNEILGVYGKTLGELLETTHFHLFTMPILLLTQGHIFMMVRVSTALKRYVVIMSFVSSAVFIAAPWMIIFLSPNFAWLLMVSRAFLAVCYLLFFIIPIHEMWFQKRSVKDIGAKI